MRLKLPKLPSTREIEAAIRARRGEIAELREMLRIAEVRELRQAAGLCAPQKKGGRTRDGVGRGC